MVNYKEMSYEELRIYMRKKESEYSPEYEFYCDPQNNDLLNHYLKMLLEKCDEYESQLEKEIEKQQQEENDQLEKKFGIGKLAGFFLGEVRRYSHCDLFFSEKSKNELDDEYLSILRKINVKPIIELSLVDSQRTTSKLMPGEIIDLTYTSKIKLVYKYVVKDKDLFLGMLDIISKCINYDPGFGFITYNFDSEEVRTEIYTYLYSKVPTKIWF